MEPRKPLSHSDLPPGHGRFMADPEKVLARWQQRVKLRGEFEQLKKQEAKIKLSPAAGDDLRANIEKAYEVYRAKLVANAKRFIEKTRGRVDGLQNLYKFAPLYHLESFVPLDIFLEAADQLSETQQGGIADEDRKTALKQIEVDKERIKAELATVSPAEDFSFCGGAVEKDLLQDFFDHWSNLQRWTVGECDSRGISLKYASEIEQKVYYRLGLDKIQVSRSAKFSAFEPIGRN